MEPLINVSRVDRRGFLKTGIAAAGGLLLGLHVPSKAHAQFGPRGGGAGGGVLTPNAFVHIGSDDVVTLIIHKPENGQGTETSIAMLLAEELECDWAKVRTEFAPIDPIYGGATQGTFGSQAIRTSWTPMRRTGAAAREMLVQAAAAKWGVGKSQCRAENGAVVNTTTKDRLTFGSLAEAAAKLPVPANPTLKDPSQFRLLGKRVQRRDTAAKSTGKAEYAIDVVRPGMLSAVIARSPVFGGTVASFDAGKARAVAGVRHVIQIPEGIAVVADNTWAAMEGRKSLDIRWDEGKNAVLTSASIRERMAALTERPGAVGRTAGQGEAALVMASRRVEAIYEAPYLAHAPMEPHTCVADVRAATCEVWAGTQIPGIAHSNAVQRSGLTADKVQVHSLYMGGGFGSRGGGAYIEEAVGISKALGIPIKLTYSREDDLQHDRYRPASFARMAAGLDADGWPTAWTARVCCSSFSFGGMRNGLDTEGIAGISDVLYSIPNVYVDYREPGIDIPTNYWRSVGHSQNTFFAECFLDELAAAGGKDPVELRRRLLSGSNGARLLGVLNLAAEKAGWGKALPSGRFHGVAAVNCFGSFNAQIAEVSVESGKVRVHRVVSAVDCGQVANPDGVVQQMESAIVYGLSAALYGEITIDKGRVQQTNLHQYQPLRMQEMPVVEVHIAPSTQAPGGMGEVGTPAIAPAVANAVFKATGKRIRRLPLSQSLA